MVNKLCVILLAISIILSNTQTQAAGYINLPQDANGWTVFTPSSDTRIMYVSETGNDMTGRTYVQSGGDNSITFDHPDWSNPQNPTGTIYPFATYGAALSHARTGYPDWVLIKRGDTLINTATMSVLTGRSVTEPFLVAAYGATGSPPLFKSNNVGGISFIQSRKYFVLSGIDFYAYTRDPDSVDYVGVTGGEGISFNGGTATKMEGILVEGCKFRFYTSNIVVGYDNAGGITFRRCIFLDNYNPAVHSQGLFASGVNDGIILEENIFDHNGWYSQAGSGGIGPATIFNHNTYFGSIKYGVFDGNIFLRASSIHNKFTANTSAVANAGNIGNGYPSDPKVDNAATFQWGTYTVTCISESADSGTFSVRAPDNSYLSNATVGSSYYDGGIYFYLTDGSTDFKIGDQFTILFSTGKSDNMLVENNLYVDGEVGISMGGNTNAPYKFTNITIKDNVLTEIGRSRPTNRYLGWGIDIYDNDVSTVSNNLIAHNNTASVTDTYGIWFGGQSRYVDFTGNVVYGIKGDGLIERTTYTGTTKTNVTVSGNYFQDNSSSGYGVDMVDDGGISFSENKYYTTKTNQFLIDATEYNLTGWQATTGDNSTIEQVTFPYPTRSIETYMTSVGETATIDAFITKCRTQDRYNWDVECSADAVNDYMRAGFGMPDPVYGGNAAMNGAGNIPLSGSGSMTLQ